MRERNSGETHFSNSQILSDLSCSLFPGRTKASSPCLRINNETYVHWNEVWSDILQLPQGTLLSSDNYLRQDVICSIHYKSVVVGMIAASFFNLDQIAYRDHSYIRVFSQERLNQENDPRISNIMSIEYLSVDNRFRKSEIGISIGSVLLGLGMKIFSESDSHIVLGTARSKIHVDEMCYKFGFRPCGEMEKFGHPCTLIVNSKNTLKNHDDPVIYEITQNLWSSKTNYLNELTTKTALAA